MTYLNCWQVSMCFGSNLTTFVDDTPALMASPETSFSDPKQSTLYKAQFLLCPSLSKQQGNDVIRLQNRRIVATLFADSPLLWSAVCHRPRLCEAEQLQSPERHGVPDNHPHQSSRRQSEVRQSWQNLCRQVLPPVHHGRLQESDVGDHCTRNPANQFGSVTGSCSSPHVDPMLTPCRPHIDPMSTPCRPHVDPMSTPCRPHADPVLAPC